MGRNHDKPADRQLSTLLTPVFRFLSCFPKLRKSFPASLKPSKKFVTASQCVGGIAEISLTSSKINKDCSINCTLYLPADDRPSIDLPSCCFRLVDHHRLFPSHKYVCKRGAIAQEARRSAGRYTAVHHHRSFRSFPSACDVRFIVSSSSKVKEVVFSCQVASLSSPTFAVFQLSAMLN